MMCMMTKIPHQTRIYKEINEPTTSLHNVLNKFLPWLQWSLFHLILLIYAKINKKNNWIIRASQRARRQQRSIWSQRPHDWRFHSQIKKSRYLFMLILQDIYLYFVISKCVILGILFLNFSLNKTTENFTRWPLGIIIYI